MDPKKFQKLLAKWNKKLADSGFKDIESQYLERTQLKTWASSIQHQYTPMQWEFNSRYFQLASQLLWEDVFLSPKDKKIWELHADGKSVAEICKAIKFSPKTVTKRINYYRKYIKDT